VFLRHRRVGRHVYTEALESVRDAQTGRLKHHVVARWRAEFTLAEIIAHIEGWMADDRRWAEYYEGVAAGLMRPRVAKHRRMAPEQARPHRKAIDDASARLAPLKALAFAHPELYDLPAGDPVGRRPLSVAGWALSPNRQSAGSKPPARSVDGAGRHHSAAETLLR
jgi:hypothetical protein